MRAPISPNEAVQRGTYLVFVPMVLLMCSMVVFWALSTTGQLHWIWALFGTIICLLITFFYWSIGITQWRIWAYARVSDIDELKKQAREYGLINDEGSFGERTELRTKAQQSRLLELERESGNRNPNQLIDDASVPDAIHFKDTKSGPKNNRKTGLILIASGTFICLVQNNYWIMIMVIIGVLFLWRSMIQMRRTIPPLTLGTFGVLIGDQQFSWNEISNESIQTVGPFLKGCRCLTFNVKEDAYNISLDKYDIGLESYKLRHYLRIYRLRNNTVNE